MYYIEQLTVRKDDDPKFDGEKMTNEYPTEEGTSFDVCPLTICRPKPPQSNLSPAQYTGQGGDCRGLRVS